MRGISLPSAAAGVGVPVNQTSVNKTDPYSNNATTFTWGGTPYNVVYGATKTVTINNTP